MLALVTVITPTLRPRFPDIERLDRELLFIAMEGELKAVREQLLHHRP
jgi:hypothetical protein